MSVPVDLPNRLEDLLTLERSLEREWWWTNGAIHGMAQLRAEGPSALRDLDTLARTIDRMRVAVSVRLAELDRPPVSAPGR